MNTPPILEQWTTKWLSNERLSTDFSLIRLAGDGSTREFFRLSVKNQKQETRFIVLYDPRWTLSQDYPAHQIFLKNAKIPVPVFRAIDPKAGVLVMEDLGDELLQIRIEGEPQKKTTWLIESIELLAKLHGETFPVTPNIPAATRRFDAKKYFEEFSFTLQHLHEGLLGLERIPASALEKIQAFCGELESISPEVFSHRDYHCRNLLVHNESLYMIDFQDARLGCPQYDIASLVYDAYVPISESERASLIDAYKNQLRSYALNEAIRWETFESGLHLVAFQRTVKAAGSFASFYTRYKKKTHLKYLAPALRYSLQLRGSLENRTASLVDELPIEKWIERFESLKLI